MRHPLKHDVELLNKLCFCRATGNLYGTTAAAVSVVIREQNKVCLIDINLDSVPEVKTDDLYV